MDNKTKSRIALSVSAAALGIISALVWPEVEPEPAPAPEPAPISEAECTGRWDTRMGCIPSYCEAFPEFCKKCDQPPCEGEPIGLVCCEPPLGCFGVHAYSDCEGDIYSCDWGYQGRNDDGSAYVICYDE